MADRNSLRFLQPRTEAATSSSPTTTATARATGAPATNPTPRVSNTSKRIKTDAAPVKGRPPTQFRKNVLRQIIRLYHKSGTSLRKIYGAVEAEEGGSWQTVMKAVEDVIGVDKKNGITNEGMRVDDAQAKKLRLEEQNNAHQYSEALYSDTARNANYLGDSNDNGQDGNEFPGSDLIDWGDSQQSEPSRKRARFDDYIGDAGRDTQVLASSRNAREVDMVKVAQRLDELEGNIFPVHRFIVERGSPTASSIWTSLSATLYNTVNRARSMALAVGAFQLSKPPARPSLPKKALDEYQFYHFIECDPDDLGVDPARILERAIITWSSSESTNLNAPTNESESNVEYGLVSFLCKAHAQQFPSAVVAKEVDRQLTALNNEDAARRLVCVADEPRKVTALHLAVAYGYYDVCAVLVKFGADLYAKTAGENSIYHFAQSAEHKAKDDLRLYSDIIRCRQHFQYCPLRHSSTWAGRAPRPTSSITARSVPRRSETMNFTQAQRQQTAPVDSTQPFDPFPNPGAAQVAHTPAAGLSVPSAVTQSILQHPVANASRSTVSTVESHASASRTLEELNSMLALAQPGPPLPGPGVELPALTYGDFDGTAFIPMADHYFATPNVAETRRVKPTTPDSGYRTQTTGDAYSAASSGSALDGMFSHGAADISRATASHGQLQHAQEMVASPLSDTQIPFPANTATTNFLPDQELASQCQRCSAPLNFEYSAITRLPRFWCPNGHGSFEMDWHPAVGS